MLTCCLNILFFIARFSLLAVCCFSLYSQQPRPRFVFQNNNINTNGVLFYNKNKIGLSKINAVLNHRMLVGWEPLAADFESPPDNTPKPDLTWHKEDAWAFYYMGNAFASGTDAPTPEELKNAFISVGIPNKIQSLKNFLRRSPNNLDAKLELMLELHRYAYQKTGKALNLAPKDFSSDPSLALMGGDTLAPDVIEELDNQADTNIWGDLAELFSTSFNSASWLSGLPGFFRRQIPENRAIYSPTMKAIYKKYISMVERELENRQTDMELWKMWRDMAKVVGRRIFDFFPQIPPLPKESTYAWPPVQVIDWMRDEARQAKDWSKIIELDWPHWPGVQSSLNMVAPVNKMPETRNAASAMQKTHAWERKILPLLEACLNNKDFDKATEIYSDLASRPAMEREAKTAFGLAKTHNYAFPQTFGNRISAPEAEMESFIGDPIAGDQIRLSPNVSSLKYLVIPNGFLTLAIIYPEPTVSRQFVPNNLTGLATGGLVAGAQIQIQVQKQNTPVSSKDRLAESDVQVEIQKQTMRILSQDRLVEYVINPLILKPDHDIAKELTERENLMDNAYAWGILDHNKKYYHGGYSPPTTESVLEVVDSMNIKSHLSIFREFARNFPESLTAKEHLLSLLQRIGTLRTRQAEKDEHGHLDESLDSDIWREYINLAGSLLPSALARPSGIFMPSPFRIIVTNNSRLLQQYHARHIESIENALQDKPHSRELWELWGAFSPYAFNRSLPSFLASLTPVPDLPNFPPAFLYPDLIKNYQSLHAWRSIIELVEPMWESYAKMMETEESVKHRLTQQLLEQYINPLCEAYEKMGQEQKTEKIRSDWKKAEGWGQS